MCVNSLAVGVVRENHLLCFSVEFNSFMNGIIQCLCLEKKIKNLLSV